MTFLANWEPLRQYCIMQDRTNRMSSLFASYLAPQPRKKR